MKAKYKKYLDALKGANLGSGQSNLSNAFSSAKTSMTSASSALSSSSYTELAAMTINNITIPKIGQALDLAGSSASSAISSVISMVEALVGSLEALEALENESDSLGEKRSYNKEKTNKAEVDKHNARVDQVKKEIEAQEASIDGQIAAINGITVDAIDIASVTIPGEASSTTDDEDKKQESSTDTGDSGVLEYTVGKLPEAGSQIRAVNRKAILLDVQVDGHSLGQDGTITIKRGQKVHLKVKVPDEIQNVKTLKRTSADGKRGWSAWVSQENYPQVNKKDSSTYVDAREYDWYITGNANIDGLTLSQTALFTIPGEKYGSYKGMVRVKVKIVD